MGGVRVCGVIKCKVAPFPGIYTTCVCESRVRVFCWRMCTHNYWGNFILLCIMVSSGVLAAEDPLRAESARNQVRLGHDSMIRSDTIRYDTIRYHTMGRVFNVL